MVDPSSTYDKKGRRISIGSCGDDGKCDLRAGDDLIRRDGPDELFNFIAEQSRLGEYARGEIPRERRVSQPKHSTAKPRVRTKRTI